MTSGASFPSPAADPDGADARVRWRVAPITPLSDLVGEGPILVVAPHPDDETIGCGGLIALAVEAGVQVQIVVLTDGSLSHPNSRSFPPERLAALRRRECLEACAVLGVAAEKVIFRDARDGSLLPSDDQVEWMRSLLGSLRPAAVFTTWVDDPHADHKAAFAIVRTAVIANGGATRLFGVPIWSWKIVVPRSRLEGAVFRLDMRAMIERKMRAFECHRTQLGQVVMDDPDGGKFNEKDLTSLRRLIETFIEVHL